jgi:hypothetical protein
MLPKRLRRQTPRLDCGGRMEGDAWLGGFKRRSRRIRVDG